MREKIELGEGRKTLLNRCIVFGTAERFVETIDYLIKHSYNVSHYEQTYQKALEYVKWAYQENVQDVEKLFHHIAEQLNYVMIVGRKHQTTEEQIRNSKWKKIKNILIRGVGNEKNNININVNLSLYVDD